MIFLWLSLNFFPYNDLFRSLHFIVMWLIKSSLCTGNGPVHETSGKSTCRKARCLFLSDELVGWLIVFLIFETSVRPLWIRVSVLVCLLYPPLPVFLYLSVSCAMYRSCVTVSRYAYWVDISGLFSNEITKSKAVLSLYRSQYSAFVFSVHMSFSVQCWCLQFLAQ